MTFKTKAGTELPLLNLRGKEYLEVKHRLVWFREEKPDWSVETELIERSEKHSVAKAIIRDAEGRVMATAHKHEDRQGFADFLEKSETGAIGRALALIGYGTQFAPELEEGERIVDAPVERTQTAKPQAQVRVLPRHPSGMPDLRGGPTEKQIARLFALGKKAGWTNQDIVNRVAEKYSKEIQLLTREEYDAICNALESSAVK